MDKVININLQDIRQYSNDVEKVNTQSVKTIPIEQFDKEVKQEQIRVQQKAFETYNIQPKTEIKNTKRISTKAAVTGLGGALAWGGVEIGKEAFLLGKTNQAEINRFNNIERGISIASSYAGAAIAGGATGGPVGAGIAVLIRLTMSAIKIATDSMRIARQNQVSRISSDISRERLGSTSTDRSR